MTSRVAMQAFVTIRRSEVPRFLHNSKLYLSLDESDEEMFVPSNCMKRNAHVNNLLDLKSMLFTLRFWILTSFSNGMIKFLVNPLNIGILEILEDFKDAFPRLLPLVASLHNAKPSDKCNIAAEFGCVDFLAYFREKAGLPLSEQTMRIAAANGHVDCLAYSHNYLLKNDNSFVLDQFYARAVAKAGHLDCLEYLVENGAFIFQETFYLAALSGQLACLKYLMSLWVHKFRADSDNLVNAALHGNHLHCLQYLIEQGCVMSQQTWQTAVNPAATQATYAYSYQTSLKAFDKLCNTLVPVQDQSTHTDCLEYLLDHATLPSDEFLLVTLACQYGNLTVLRLLHQRGFQFNPELVKVAAQAGSLPCLHFLHDTLHFDCWVPATMAAAAGAGHLLLVNQLHEMGCAWDESAPIDAKRHHREECLVFLLQQRGIPESAMFHNTPTDILCRLAILEYQVKKLENTFGFITSSFYVI